MPGARLSPARATEIVPGEPVSWAPDGGGGRSTRLARRASFWPGDLCSVLKSPATPRLARAARDALPAASRSRGASPHPRLPRPALSLLHPQVLRHFSPRQEGREKRKRPSVCNPASAAAQEEERRGEAIKLWFHDNKKNHHPQQGRLGYTHPGSRWGSGGRSSSSPPRWLWNLPQAVHTRTPFSSTKGRGRNKRDPHSLHSQTQIFYRCSRYAFLQSLWLTPSPPE